ncbi:2-dehydropantoate 2-reductase [Shewanella electrodiphila]|uniref:2-dehydropantoate 2-reductase n=1 Tax=Shewanella electrodiphila TaxID=934143 RepID=A0ABT0KJ13_9GAMM|nr:2-dehydropantoate 2-reductase [Shewanella electrodiphila]MCL1043833.1 2-dehydropantoate 2-reductase [Shewanella electrodiphila]
MRSHSPAPNTVTSNTVTPNNVTLNIAPANIAIVGAGAIGMLIYHQLNAFTQPLLLGRNFTLADAENQTKPLTFNALSSDVKPSNVVNVHTEPCLVNNLKTVTPKQLASIELVIVCVKSYQVEAALTALIDKLPHNATLLLLHNGMGPHLQVMALLASQQRTDINLYLGTTSQAAIKVTERHVRQTGTGKTVFGHFHGHKLTPQLIELLVTAIPNSQISDNILLGLWQKLIVNCAINPITAIEQCQNGQLAQPQYQQQINAITTECVAVANAEGITISLSESLETIAQVITLTANNFSSMHQDVKHRRMTEIAQINGFVAARAGVHQIKTPANNAMTDKINQLTQPDL